VKGDHSNADCIAFAISTHGEKNDMLHAKDKMYSLEDLCLSISADKCKTLAGKPKLFFIQACRGNQFDTGTWVSTDSPEGRGRSDQNLNYTYKIPNHADFFLAYSTIPGNTTKQDVEESKFFPLLNNQVTKKTENI